MAPPQAEEELQCAICMDIMEHPVETGCGHSFCGGCIIAQIQSQSTNCCICRTPLASVHPSFTLRRMVDRHWAERGGRPADSPAGPPSREIDAKLRELFGGARTTSAGAAASALGSSLEQMDDTKLLLGCLLVAAVVQGVVRVVFFDE